MPGVRETIGLEAVPHWTTLQKFFTRTREAWLMTLIKAYSCRVVAVDSTGFPAYK